MARDQWVIWKDELYRLKDDGSMFEGCVCLETDEKGALKFGEMSDETEPVMLQEDGVREEKMQEEIVQETEDEDQGCGMETARDEPLSNESP